MSPSKMYCQLRRTRNMDAWGGSDPGAPEYHKTVYAGAHLRNRGGLTILEEDHSKTGGQT